MRENTSVLVSFRKVMKLYDQHMEEIRKIHQLSSIEITIISFLYNNPGKDTARDISEMRMLPKGNVSQGVDSLIHKSLLKRTPDTEDRRKIHLALTELAIPIVQKIDLLKEAFQQQLFQGFSQEELQIYAALNARIIENSSKGFERNEET